MQFNKLFLPVLILFAIITFQSLPAMAEPVTDQLFQEPYRITRNGIMYELTFMQGPFGPGYNGLAVLRAPGGIEQAFSFIENPSGSGFIEISGFANFCFSGAQIIWGASEYLMLEAAVK